MKYSTLNTLLFVTMFAGVVLAFTGKAPATEAPAAQAAAALLTGTQP